MPPLGLPSYPVAAEGDKADEAPLPLQADTQAQATPAAQEADLIDNMSPHSSTNEDMVIDKAEDAAPRGEQQLRSAEDELEREEAVSAAPPSPLSRPPGDLAARTALGPFAPATPARPLRVPDSKMAIVFGDELRPTSGPRPTPARPVEPGARSAAAAGRQPSSHNPSPLFDLDSPHGFPPEHSLASNLSSLRASSTTKVGPRPVRGVERSSLTQPARAPLLQDCLYPGSTFVGTQSQSVDLTGWPPFTTDDLSRNHRRERTQLVQRDAAVHGPSPQRQPDRQCWDKITLTPGLTIAQDVNLADSTCSGSLTICGLTSERPE
jgi:hypothetical protein